MKDQSDSIRFRATASSLAQDAISLGSVSLVAMLVVGLVLAIVGKFEPILFFGVTVPLSGGAWWYVRSPAPSTAGVGITWRVVAIGVLAVGVVTFLNVTSSAEHLQTNRDPGVYLTTGKWLEVNGNLLIDGTTQGFADLDGVSGWTGGYYDSREDGRLYAQFNHGFPVMLAISNWVGGDRLMFNLNPLIGAVFLIVLLGLLLQFFEGWIALIALGTAAFNLVFWHFARDTYSEPLVALLLVLALVAFDVADRRGLTRLWVLSGALIGASALVRIDAWFYIAIFSGVIAIHFISVRGEHRPGFGRRDALAALLAAWSIGIIGYTDLVTRSPGYLADLWPNVKLMLAAAAVAGSAALLIIVFAGTAVGVREWARRVWGAAERPVRLAGAFVVIGFFVWAMYWRPRFGVAQGHQSGLVSGLMVREGVPADPTRSFFELSVRWLSWYWGFVGVVVAFLGWAIAVGFRSLAGRPRFYVSLMMTGLALMPYIINPSITPDQLWAMRRFYPTVLVGVAVAVGVLLTWLVSSMRTRWVAKWGEVAALIVASGLLAGVPLSVAMPLATASTQVGMYGSTTMLCDELPDDAAVLVEPGRLATVYPAAVRSFCGVPVASLETGAGRAEIDAAGVSWKERGRSLYLLGSRDSCIIDGESSVFSRFMYTFPERTLTRAPSQSSTAEFSWELARWDAPEIPADLETAWELEIETTWTPPDSSSIIATEGHRSDARWWLEYRPSGVVEFWVNTDSVPVGVGFPVRLDDGVSRTIEFGWRDGVIYIGCGSALRTVRATHIVDTSGSIEMGNTYDGVFGNWKFVGTMEVRPRE